MRGFFRASLRYMVYFAVVFAAMAAVELYRGEIMPRTSLQWTRTVIFVFAMVAALGFFCGGASFLEQVWRARKNSN